MTSLSEIGIEVRVARRASGLRQRDLADAAGVSRFTVIKLERGQLSDINFKTLVAILAPLRLELRLSAMKVSGLPVLGEPE